MGLLSKKIGLIMGLANDHSIAWAISEALYAGGAELGFTHLPNRSNERRVRNLVEPKGAKMIFPATCRTTKTSSAPSTRSARPTGSSISSSTRSPSPRRRN